MKKLVRESLTKKKLTVGDQIHVVRGNRSGIFVPAVVIGTEGDMIEYETDYGDIGTIKLSSPRLSI